MAIVTLIGISRLYPGVHFFSDVAPGWRSCLVYIDERLAQTRASAAGKYIDILKDIKLDVK